MERDQKFPGLLSGILTLSVGTLLWIGIIATMIAAHALPAALSEWLSGLAARAGSQPLLRIVAGAFPAIAAALALNYRLRRMINHRAELASAGKTFGASGCSRIGAVAKVELTVPASAVPVLPVGSRADLRL